jgi:hypothetical protein
LKSVAGVFAETKTNILKKKNLLWAPFFIPSNLDAQKSLPHFEKRVKLDQESRKPLRTRRRTIFINWHLLACYKSFVVLHEKVFAMDNLSRTRKVLIAIAAAMGELQIW